MKILFLCADNSAYSQLAEGLARQILSDEAHIMSAGHEAQAVKPELRQTLTDLGMDPTRFDAKGIEDLPATFVHELDFAITLCEERLDSPRLLHAKQLHWPFPDEAQGEHDHFRTAVTHLRTQIAEFGREYDILRSESTPRGELMDQPGL